MSELLPEEVITKNAYDASAREWTSQHHSAGFWSTEMQRFQELLPHGSLLEIGSGGGRDAVELIQMGYSYTGTDVSPGLLEIARSNVPGQMFLEQSVYDLDVPGAPFDGFWASAVLLHIPRERIGEALVAIHSQVRSGAIGFISLKDGDTAQIETDIVDGVSVDRFFCRWPKDAFAEILTENGFNILDYTNRPMSVRTNWHSFFVEAK